MKFSHAEIMVALVNLKTITTENGTKYKLIFQTLHSFEGQLWVKATEELGNQLDFDKVADIGPSPFKIDVLNS